MASLADMQKIAQAFVQHYYTTFDTNRAQLSSLYQQQSMLTFENDQFMGAEAIGNKLNGLPFRKVVHNILTMDIQPSGCGGIIIVVCGDLKIDEEPNPLKYSQTFHIMPTQSGSWWVHNDLFRLNIG